MSWIQSSKVRENVRLVVKRRANGGNLQACISGIYGKRQFWHRKIARVYSALCSRKAKSARAKSIYDTVLDIHILYVAIRILCALVTIHCGKWTMSVRLYHCNRIIIIAFTERSFTRFFQKRFQFHRVINVSLLYFYCAWDIDSRHYTICILYSHKVIPSKEKSRGNSILIRRDRITGYILNYSNLIYFTACLHFRSFKATIALTSLKLTPPIPAKFFAW